MFRTRRSPAPLPETAKVAEVVQAYYDAGRRPSSHLKPLPEPANVAAKDLVAPGEAFFTAPEPEFAAEPELEPAPVLVAEAPSAGATQHSATVHKTLAELAEELEAFIEVIRYGDDLGSSTARN